MSIKKRYAAELLFEFDKRKGGKSTQKKRICEKKIFLFRSNSDEEVYADALNRGKEEQFSFEGDGCKIHYNFIGILELISLDDEDEDVVWWYFVEKLVPREKKNKIIPGKNELKLFNKTINKHKMKLLKK